MRKVLTAESHADGLMCFDMDLEPLYTKSHLFVSVTSIHYNKEILQYAYRMGETGSQTHI